MELFTLGRGHYTEKDIQEAARAFTGWFVVRDRVPGGRRASTTTARRPSWATPGEFGRRRHPGDPARAARLRRVPLRQARSGTSSARSTRRPPALIAPLAQAFRESGYRHPGARGDDPALEPVLRPERPPAAGQEPGRVRRRDDPGARDPQADGRRPTPWPRPVRRMGQSLYAPPSVAGWDGGPAWINSTTMLARTNLALALLSDDDDALGQRLRPRGAGRAARFRRPPERCAGSSSICWSQDALRRQGPASRSSRPPTAKSPPMPRPRPARRATPDPDLARISACVTRPRTSNDGTTMTMPCLRAAATSCRSSLAASTLVAMGATTVPTFLGRSARGGRARPSRTTGSSWSCSSSAATTA